MREAARIAPPPFGYDSKGVQSWFDSSGVDGAGGMIRRFLLARTYGYPRSTLRVRTIGLHSGSTVGLEAKYLARQLQAAAQNFVG